MGNASGVVAVTVSIATVVGASIGALSGGTFPAFAGACIGAFGGVMVGSVVRYRRARGQLGERAIPSTEGLTPQQALAMISAAAGGEGLRSPLLKEVAEARDLAETSPDGSRDRLEGLARENPRSPPVLAELAEARRRVGAELEALEPAGAAIARALEQGANPVAARVYLSFADDRDGLPLEATALERLARVLDAQGHSEHADWCREKMGSEPGTAPDPLG